MDRDTNPILKTLYINLYRHEFGLGEWLVLSWDIFSKNFYILVLAGLILYLPLLAASELTLLPAMHLSDLAAVVIVNSINFVTTLLVYLASFRIVEAYLGNQAITVTGAMGFSFARLWKTSWTALLAAVIVSILSLLIIPGIIWGIYYSFFIFVVAEKNVGGRKALSYSKALVSGRWWKVFGYSLYIFLLIATTSLGMSWVLDWLTIGISNRLFIHFLSIILSAYSTVALIVLYLNLEHNRRTPPKLLPPNNTTI